MDVKRTEKIEVTLTLNSEEAQWLKGVMQNPLYVTDPTLEDPQDKKFRRMFWDVLGGDAT